MIPGVVPGDVAPRPIPGRRQYQGWRQMFIFVYTGHRSCLYQSLVYSSSGSLVTPVASWGRALGGSVNPRGAIPASLAGLAPVQARSSWRQGSRLVFLRQPGIRDVQHRGWPNPSVECSCFWQGGVDLQPRVWASGAGQQRVYNTSPLSSSFPCLSIGISH